MMEMPIRARRRLEDVAVTWQERRTRSEDMRQQQADIRRRRMTVSDRIPSIHQTQDWTGSMEMSPSGRFQVIEEPTQRQRLFVKDGIRWDAAWIAIVAVCAILAGILLADLAGIGRSMKSISKLNSRIEVLGSKNGQLQNQLELSTDDLSVCTEAVKLNLIASGGATVVRLTAPENATLMLTASANTQANPQTGNTAGD